MIDSRLHLTKRVRHIHFIGIGGIGMSGIAQVLHNIGYVISGSDIAESNITQSLRNLGIKVSIGHCAKNIERVDAIVFSSAIDEQNEELSFARAQSLPVMHRTEILAELMRFNFGIAVAGTHGKTTTTSLIASILSEASLDPTYIIGGQLIGTKQQAKFGKGDYIVVEADESDASFLYLHPMMTVITNIDRDHMDTYNGNFQEMHNNFVQFLQRLPFYGMAILCIDDPEVRKIIPSVTKPMQTYGLVQDADYYIDSIKQDGSKSQMIVHRQKQRNWLELEINLLGQHNLLNVLAAVVVAHEIGIEDHHIISALKNFKGILRRCQVRGDIKINGMHITLIDDYAHHPTEITACLETISSVWPMRRIVVIYQPHRYTRMRDLFEDFRRVLSSVDGLILMEVYAAGEQIIQGADSHALYDAIHLKSQISPILVKQHEGIWHVLPDILEDNDVLLTLGAGDIGYISEQIYQRYH